MSIMIEYKMFIIIWHCCILRSNNTVCLRAISDRKRRIQRSYVENTDTRIDGPGSYICEINLKRKSKKFFLLKFLHTYVTVSSIESSVSTADGQFGTHVDKIISTATRVLNEDEDY